MEGRRVQEDENQIRVAMGQYKNGCSTVSGVDFQRGHIVSGIGRIWLNLERVGRQFERALPPKDFADLVENLPLELGVQIQESANLVEEEGIFKMDEGEPQGRGLKPGKLGSHGSVQKFMVLLQAPERTSSTRIDMM
ncbi:hypothetical protein PanWU01x14_358310 [Parasponia andersonii]|uniref:Uncharacterized protein n=1 Tax=Parasponia andersonii TaxID=3476 RepID=A0A2P5A8C1_PARAD|nr:hypothetical protein PanWU01x14_358310 [Parasponia andersonii]